MKTILLLLLMFLYSNILLCQTDLEHEFEFEYEYDENEEFVDSYADCDPLIVYGDKNHPSYLRASFEGRERYIYFPDAIIAMANGEIIGILLPSLTTKYGQLFDSYINIESKSGNNYNLKFEFDGSEIYDCAPIIPYDLHSGNRVSTNMIINEIRPSSTSPEFISLTFTFRSAENNSDFLIGHIETNKFINIEEFAISIFPESNNSYSSEKVFYSEKENKLYVSNISSLLKSQMKSIDINSGININEFFGKITIIEIEKFDKKSAKLNYYSASIDESKENRIFRFVNNSNQADIDKTLNSSILMENVIPLPYLEPIDIPIYSGYEQWAAPRIKLTPDDLPKKVEYKVNKLNNLIADYCPMLLEMTCITEEILIDKEKANLKIKMEQRMITSEADEFFEEYSALALSIREQYPDIEMVDFGTAEDDIRIMIHELLDRHLIPHEKPVDIMSFWESIWNSDVYYDRFGRAQFERAIQNYNYKQYSENFSIKREFPEIELLLNSNNAQTVKRIHKANDTEFELEYAKTQVMLKANNPAQGEDFAQVQIPEGTVDLYSLPTVLAFTTITPDFNQEYIVFDLAIGLTMSFSYSSDDSYEIDEETGEEHYTSVESENTMNEYIHAEPVYLKAEIEYVDEMHDYMTDMLCYRLRVNVMGDYSEVPWSAFVRPFEEAEGNGFYLLVDKNYPHKLINIQ